MLCYIKPGAYRGQGVRHIGFFSTQGLTASPLFDAPGFRLRVLRRDWLHIMDLGVGCDWLGQLFRFLLRFFPGANQERRVAALWRKVQEGYTRRPPFAKLDNLTPAMVGLGKAHAKLRCYGSECRGLIPVAEDMAEELLADNNDEVVQAVLRTTRELASLYRKASAGAHLADSRRRAATLWVALESALPGEFHIKPKLHLMQEWPNSQTNNRWHDTTT